MSRFPWVVEYLAGINGDVTRFKVFDNEKVARDWVRDCLIKVVAIWQM